MQLSRETIITAAIEILDAYGLGDMTMRRLAKHLDVVPGALYWHIPNKQSLIEAIAEQILEPVWQAADVEKHSAAQLCGDLRRAMIAHRDGAEVVSAALPVGDITPRLRTALMHALDAEGFSAAVATNAADTLMNYTMGATMHEQSSKQLGEAIGTPTRSAEEEKTQFFAGVRLIMAGASALG